MSSRLFTRIALSLGLVLAMLCGGRAAADTRELNVLLVIDTNAGKVGGNIEEHRTFNEKNLVMWQTLINDVYRSGTTFKGRLWVTVLKDNNVSPARIRQHYKNLAYKPDRALLFVYAGHGGIGTQGQYFASSGGGIARAEVRQLMSDCGAPAVFIFSDCCSTMGNMAQETTNEAPVKNHRMVNAAAFYQLFYQWQGVVEITAAKPGELAFSGLFTTVATDCFYQPNHRIRADGRNGPVTWNDYYGRVQQASESLFASFKIHAPLNHAIRRVRTQSPHMTISSLAARTAGHGTPSFVAAIHSPATSTGHSAGSLNPVIPTRTPSSGHSAASLNPAIPSPTRTETPYLPKSIRRVEITSDP